MPGTINKTWPFAADLEGWASTDAGLVQALRISQGMRLNMPLVSIPPALVMTEGAFYADTPAGLGVPVGEGIIGATLNGADWLQVSTGSPDVMEFLGFFITVGGVDVADLGGAFTLVQDLTKGPIPAGSGPQVVAIPNGTTFNVECRIQYEEAGTTQTIQPIFDNIDIDFEYGIIAGGGGGGGKILTPSWPLAPEI